MVRKAGWSTARAPDRAARCSDEWVRVSWERPSTWWPADPARPVDFGPRRSTPVPAGWKSVGMFHNSRTLLHRLMNLWGFHRLCR